MVDLKSQYDKTPTSYDVPETAHMFLISIATEAEALDIVKQVQKEIWNLALDDRKKLELVDKCGDVEFHLVEGSDEYVQLESFLAFAALVGKE